MLNMKIETHNTRAKELTRAIAEYHAKLAEELEKGDFLKAEEVRAYAEAKGVKTVWLWADDQFSTVYSGEFFDFSGDKKPLESRGTHDGRVLKEQLRKMADLHKESTCVPWGDRDVRLREILVVTFP